MAKKGTSESRKITLNKKSGRGVAKKIYGPKSEKPKKYRGQGR
jgi:hypothetical protein